MGIVLKGGELDELSLWDTSAVCQLDQNILTTSDPMILPFYRANIQPDPSSQVSHTHCSRAILSRLATV